MDNFDDLLANSRRALEENPFEDPFAKRSNSPDPWASYGQTSQQNQHDDVFASHHNAFADDGFEGGGAFTSSGSGSGSGLGLGTSTSTSAGLLEKSESTSSEGFGETPSSSSVTERHIVQSPGFRESTSTDEEIITAATPTSDVKETSSSLLAVRSRGSSPSPSPTRQPESPTTPTNESFNNAPSTAASIASPTASIPTSTSDKVNAPLYPTSPSSPPPQPAPSTSTPASSLNARVEKVVSPLDKAPISGTLDRSFAGLALGGEFVGGWGEAHPSGFGTAQHSDYREREVAVDVSGQESSEVNTAPESSDAKDANTSTKSGQALPHPIVVTVDDPQKVGDPIRPYILYTVHTETTNPHFSKHSFSVLRRYSDFLWLYEALTLNNPGVIVPPVPDKAPFGRFEGQFVQQRRMALEKCVQKIVSHPVLVKDPDLKMFLESDTFALDSKHRKMEIAQEKGGIMSSVGQVLAGPRFYEQDEWFDNKKAYLDTLESQLKGLVRAIEMVSRQRADLAIVAGEFAQAVGDLSECDLGRPLSSSLTVLTDVEKKVQDNHQTQAQEDVNTFLSVADEYSRIINSVRVAFSSRIRCYNQWQNAESELKRVRQVHEKARSQGRISQDRMGHSMSQVADYERRVFEAKQEFEKCGKLIKSEMGRFEEERIRDFKLALESFVEGMISRQKVIIAAWERHQELLLKTQNGSQATSN